MKSTSLLFSWDGTRRPLNRFCVGLLDEVVERIMVDAIEEENLGLLRTKQ